MEVTRRRRSSDVLGSSRAVLVLLVLTMVAAACVSAKDSPSTVGSDASDAMTLAGASLSAEAVEELDRVCFRGINVNGDFGALELIMTADGAEPVSLSLYLDDEGLYTPAPLHPLTPGSGGVVELQLMNGDARSSLMPLELTGLPAEPGAWQATISRMKAELDSRATQAGSSLDELASTSFGEVGDDLAALKILQGYIDDGTDNDLESLLAKPDSGLTDDDRALIDSVVGKISPFTLISGGTGEPRGCGNTDGEALGGHGSNDRARIDDSVGTFGLSVLKPAINGVSLEAPVVSVPPRVTAIRAVAAPLRLPAIAAQGSTCRVFDLAIGNGAELADAIEKGVDAQVQEGGAEEKVLEDINAVINIGSDIPGYGELIGAVGTMFATISLWYASDAGRYPTRFTSITAQVSTETFNEDYTTRGRVTSVTVTAASIGFDASSGFQEVVSSLLDILADKGVGKLKKGVGELGDAGDAAIDYGGKLLRDAATAKLIEAYGKEFLQFCPQPWTVEITDPAYVDIAAVIGLIKVDKTALSYEPAKLGTDSLRVRARGDAFSGLTIQTDIPVETKQLRVIATQRDVVVASPGDGVDITAILQNADTTTLFWNTPKGRWVDGTGADTNDGGTRKLKTPSDPKAYPFVIEVRSTSKTGLRKESTEIRKVTITVKLQGLFVTPAPGIVLTENRLQFSATDKEGKPRKVTWKATGGSIDSDGGLYSAGKTPGVYTVTATAIDDRKITATVSVEVVEAKCPVGTWRLREQAFLDQIERVTGDSEISITHASGQYLMIFNADRTMVGIRDNWAIRSEIDEGAIITTITSTDPGRWSIDGDQLTIIDGGSEAEVEVVFIVDGISTPISAGSSTVSTEGISGTGPFSCSNNVLELTGPDGITATLDYQGPP
jgi:hypothetical protein